jgi:hypothetical protein
LISEYGMWLTARTNKHHQPFQQDTTLADTETARVLDRWMTQQGIDGDFTACVTVLLNRFFATTSPPTAKAAPTPASATCATVHPVRGSLRARKQGESGGPVDAAEGEADLEADARIAYAGW